MFEDRSVSANLLKRAALAGVDLIGFYGVEGRRGCVYEIKKKEKETVWIYVMITREMREFMSSP